MTITRKDTIISLPGGVELAAWLYVPEGDGPFPAVTMAHGLGGIRQQGLEPVAERIAEAGYVVSLHDHRNFGASTGTPRHDIDPWQQIEDWRRVIAFLQTRGEVDPARIGIWGTSFSGGHAIVLGATDRTIKAVYAQVPTVDGFAAGQRRIPPHLVKEADARFAADEVAQARGEAPARQAFASADPDVQALFRAPDAVGFYLQDIPEGAVWENSVTLQSIRRTRYYSPGWFIDKISPTPLFMLVGDDDMITLPDLSLKAYEQALQPKQLKIVPGGHFDPYRAGLEESISTAIRFFGEHL